MHRYWTSTYVILSSLFPLAEQLKFLNIQLFPPEQSGKVEYERERLLGIANM
jgi:hypothetical protein